MDDRVISFVIPSRNNLTYLKWSYNSIRKNLGYTHEIMLADDFSSDGTWKWLQEIKKMDINVQIFKNEGPERKGIVYWYDFLCEKASSDIVMFFHADMYACPKLDEEILKHLQPGKVVSATRIEPPLHPDGPEKILLDFGIEPEEFKEEELLKTVEDIQTGRDGILYGPLALNSETTQGIFAPWAIYKEDYWKTGGHDVLFAPQSKEDSDIFNRFHLLGYELIQTWKGLVYHMTSRGSRFNPYSGGGPGKDSPEWIHTTTKNMRNFIRKWGHMVKHDELMHPIIPPKYDVGFMVENCSTNMLKELEPWCSDIYGDWVGHKGYGVNQYIEEEQKDTQFNLSKKIHSQHIEPKNNIVVRFDANKLTPQNFQILVNLSEILKESGEVGEMEQDIFKLNIKSLQTYEKDLIVCKTN
jgi:glycosyltransferase involved in cell wall biosynthesis